MLCALFGWDPQRIHNTWTWEQLFLMVSGGMEAIRAGLVNPFISAPKSGYDRDRREADETTLVLSDPKAQERVLKKLYGSSVTVTPKEG